MSSESLPLIFEPLEDVPPEGASVVTLLPGRAQPIAAMATGKMPLSEVDMDQLVTVETDSDDPSNAPPLLVPEWTSQWQTSGTELREPISSPDLSVSQQRTSTEAGWDQVETGEARLVCNLRKDMNEIKCRVYIFLQNMLGNSYFITVTFLKQGPPPNYIIV